MRKVCVVVTARPSYSRIKTVLDAVAAHPGLELQLVVAASALLDRYGSVVNQIEADGFTIDTYVYMVLEGENPTTMAKTTGIGIMELSTAFHNLRPDAVVTVADRYETMATAIAASYSNIPVAHIQGGEVSGSIDEKVRHAVTKLADLHFVATDLAGERVRRMGEADDRVFVTGCPSIDLAATVADTRSLDFDPFSRYGGVGQLVDLEKGYLVVMQHPVTTEHAQARFHIEETLQAVSANDLPALWFWPNVDAGSDGTSNGLRTFRENNPEAPIHFFKNMAPMDFLKLSIASRAIVGNSSVAIRECSFLGVPAVNVGGRQFRRERGGNVIDTGYSSSEIADAISDQLEHGPYPASTLYGDGKAGLRIAELLATAPLTYDKQLAY
jgi:UDP-hydrolysing UDP-N-acetyl-D-glucosamine 2-epimerase